MPTIQLHCDLCGDTRWFEKPPCTDDHGVDCPELACASCGAALLTGVPPLLAPRQNTAARRRR